MHFPLTAVLKYMGISRSTYYYHKAHKSSDKFAKERLAIREIYEESHGAYGYRRVAFALERRGIHRDRKTVAKIMRQEKLCGKYRKKRAYSSYKGTVGRIADNVLKRDFSTSGPMQKLTSDVTQFNIKETKIYLSPLIDMWNGEVISWRISRSPNMDMAMGMLSDAEARLKGSGAIIHTDQGWQYQNPKWVYFLKSCGCTQSMSRKGNCLDNAIGESFFARLKTEFSDGSDYRSWRHFVGDLNSYIHWYNEKRIKGSLCGMAPIEYRKHHESMTLHDV